MIVVKMIKHEPDAKYENATRFYVEQNGNLTIKTEAEIVAIHANGTWASVSVDNTQKYADKLTPEMKSGGWSDVTDDSLVYDCRGTSWCNGVTNFCVGNVTDALAACKLPAHRENLTLLIDVSLFNRLDDSNQLDRTQNGIKWHRFNMEVNPVDQDVSKGFLNTFIRHTSGKTIKLITREF